MRLLRSLVLGLLILSLANVSPAPAARASSAASRPAAILLERADRAGLARLLRAGAQQLADYGAFSLWQPLAAAGTALNGVDSLSGLPRAGTRIDLRGLTIDTASAQPEPALPAGLDSAPRPPRTSWAAWCAGRAHFIRSTACIPPSAPAQPCAPSPAWT
jgi:hypothetical protein